MFFSEFCEIFKNTFLKEHLQMVAPGIYLWICRSFSEHLRTAYFIYKLQDFNQHIKLFHRYLSRFCKRTRSNYSKVFIWLKPLKVICEEVNLQWSCEMLACTFTKKSILRIFLHVFCLHFLRTHPDYFFQRVFERVPAHFLLGNINKKYCYL